MLAKSGFFLHNLLKVIICANCGTVIDIPQLEGHIKAKHKSLSNRQREQICEIIGLLGVQPISQNTNLLDYLAYGTVSVTSKDGDISSKSNDSSSKTSNTIGKSSDIITHAFSSATNTKSSSDKPDAAVGESLGNGIIIGGTAVDPIPGLAIETGLKCPYCPAAGKQDHKYLTTRKGLIKHIREAHPNEQIPGDLPSFFVQRLSSQPHMKKLYMVNTLAFSTAAKKDDDTLMSKLFQSAQLASRGQQGTKSTDHKVGSVIVPRYLERAKFDATLVYLNKGNRYTATLSAITTNARQINPSLRILCQAFLMWTQEIAQSDIPRIVVQTLMPKTAADPNPFLRRIQSTYAYSLEVARFIEFIAAMSKNPSPIMRLPVDELKELEAALSNADNQDIYKWLEVRLKDTSQQHLRRVDLTSDNEEDDEDDEYDERDGDALETLDENTSIMSFMEHPKHEALMKIMSRLGMFLFSQEFSIGLKSVEEVSHPLVVYWVLTSLDDHSQFKGAKDIIATIIPLLKFGVLSVLSSAFFHIKEKKYGFSLMK